MNNTALYLYDDDRARSWQPFALTRPVGELMLGAYTFRERAERWVGSRCAGHITAPHLRGFDEHDGAPVVEPADIATDRARVFVSSRAVPDWAALPAPTDAALLRIDGTVIGRYVPAGVPNPDAGWFADGAARAGTAETVLDLGGRVLEQPWDLIAANPRQLVLDYDASSADDAARNGASGASFEPGAAGSGVQTIGYRAGLLRLGEGVMLEPNVVLDFSHGPIWLADGVTVRAFTRLAGPAYVGPRSTLLGGPYEAVTIGPVCRVHGEVEESVVLGYSNKAHDGFLGHAYLGRWVNLGAMTTNSDLKNNYGTIRMWTPAGEQDTGLIKLGCLLGDHVKTGIGALLNTGTVIGAGSNLYGTAMPPKYVPPFSWGSGSDLTTYDIEKFLDVTATVHGRRELELGAGMREVLRAAWQQGRAQ
jgi:UDP-N-acetylglucosamine diphosphorylase / glucose-1-phosphate thymidylyltransferase / UDP-N-acetylgalactosamine diphosphorylase / glucosamine-1-phosphate N-acetyltransferase / galactosamine-1-phosphate N-acetyltransferase